MPNNKINIHINGEVRLIENSQSIESFYQEAGRAGRDFRYKKKPALALALRKIL